MICEANHFPPVCVAITSSSSEGAIECSPARKCRGGDGFRVHAPKGATTTTAGSLADALAPRIRSPMQISHAAAFGVEQRFQRCEKNRHSDITSRRMIHVRESFGERGIAFQISPRLLAREERFVSGHDFQSCITPKIWRAGAGSGGKLKPGNHAFGEMAERLKAAVC